MNFLSEGIILSVKILTANKKFEFQDSEMNLKMYFEVGITSGYICDRFI